MHILNICNTFFEGQLSQNKPLSLEDAFEQHPVYLQLQYLPFLYADPQDALLVTAKPDENFFKKLQELNIPIPHFHLLQERSFPQYQKIDSWGHSKEILSWAQKHHQFYEMPGWDVVKKVNSKAFSFALCPLEGGELISSENQLSHWLSRQQGQVVLKTCFGSSGRGHLHIDLHRQWDKKKVQAFIYKQFEQNLPIIAEPWMERTLDFSTQWEISPQGAIQKIGETLCENDSKGRYVSNSVGDRKFLFGKQLDFLHQHEEFAAEVLQNIKDLGYFGNVGLDAMIYKKGNALHLHPLVEINARKTMGWTASASSCEMM